jgi:Family of unknown function (DUF5335)
MAIRRLERDDWGGFCMLATQGYFGRQVSIEVVSLEIGAQPEVQRSPLVGMSYDSKNDVLQVLLGEVSHLVHSPRELYVDEGSVGAAWVEVVDADGIRQILTLREPAMLPGSALPV